MKVWLLLVLASHSQANVDETCSMAAENKEEPQTASSTESKPMKRVARRIVKSFTAHSQKEGGGFTVNRPYPGRYLTDQEADPYLLIDELGPVNYQKGEFEGAPWHPHRGFVTLTYIKSGEGAHQDSAGNKGVVRAGEIQYMVAGSGIVHDEGRDHPGGVLHGFQIWINLPSKNKMDPPSYQMITKETLVWKKAGKNVRTKLLCGEIPGVAKSPIQPLAPVMLVDFETDADAEYDIPIPNNLDTVMVYCYDGEGTFEGMDGQKSVTLKRKDTILYSETGTHIKFTSSKGVKFLLFSGKKTERTCCKVWALRDEYYEGGPASVC